MQGNIVVEKHIFQDAASLFADKIHSFHDEFVDRFLLIGVDDSNKQLDEVKMTKNPDFSMLYYKRIVGGILENPPLISIKSFLKNKLSADCGIYYLNNGEDIEDFFLTQNIYQWEGTSKACFQVWRLNFLGIFDMNEHWL